MSTPELRCANPDCQSIDVQSGLDHFQCMVCGRLTSFQGELFPAEPVFMVSQADGPWRNNVGEEPI